VTNAQFCLDSQFDLASQHHSIRVLPTNTLQKGNRGRIMIDELTIMDRNMLSQIARYQLRVQ
jgi:hypothetical protein